LFFCFLFFFFAAIFAEVAIVSKLIAFAVASQDVGQVHRLGSPGEYHRSPPIERSET
jgi:hypothetical protein